MIIARAPFRISFVGGGTDFPDYYQAAVYGNVISTTINKYIYVTLIKKFDGKISLKYSQHEIVDNVANLQHDIVREGLKMFDVKSGIEIDIISDIPAAGSGLGSSSALAAALLMALSKFKGRTLDGRKLAEKACQLEIDILKKNIGKQDQYAICLGGFQRIIFWGNGMVESDYLSKYREKNCDKKIDWLQRTSMLFYVDGNRQANFILQYHKNRIKTALPYLNKQRELVNEFLFWLKAENDFYRVGNLVTLSWHYKKTVTPEATNEKINALIDRALNAGACGAKMCGAGGGGFMLVICEPEKQDMVRAALRELPEITFDFENEGAKMLYAN